MDLQLALITGVDIPIPECQLILHQPKIREIAMLGEQDFFIGTQILLANKSLIENKGNFDLSQVSNFEIFIEIVQDKRLIEQKEKMLSSLSLLFPNTKCMILPNSMILSKDGQNSVIDMNNFETFQEVIGKVFCLGQNGKGGFNPSGSKAEEIAEKLRKARQRVAKEKGENDNNSFSAYVSSLSIALGLSLQELSEYTIFQLYDSIERYSLYMAWDMDIKARLAGAKPDEKVENWMKNLH